MVCDYEDVNETGMIITTYNDALAKVFEFVQPERVAFKRRLDITYDSETALHALIQSAHICHESFDLVCINDSYADHLGNYAVACRCKRFVRQTTKTFWPGNQNLPSDFNRDYIDKGYNTSAQ